MGSSTKDGRSLLTNVKGSKKVMISGPIINSDQKSEYKRYLDNEATKVGEVDEIDIVELPKMFLLPDVRTSQPNRVAVLASVLFKNLAGPAKMMSELNGKMYERFCCIEVSRINEKATLQEIIDYIGTPDYDTERFKYAIVSGVFLNTDDKDQAKAELVRLQNKLKDLAKYDKIEAINLTTEFKLTKKEGKEAFAFSIEFPDYDSTQAAETLYKEIEEFNIHLKMLDDKIATKDILQEIPAHNHVYNTSPNEVTNGDKREDLLDSDSDSDSDGEFDAKMREYKTEEDFPENATNALKIRGFKFKQKTDKKNAKIYLMREFQKKDAIGCPEKCDECDLCKDPIKVTSKKGKVTMKCNFFDVKNATKIKSNFDNKSSNYGLLKIDYSHEDSSDESGDDDDDDESSSIVLTKYDVVLFLPPTFFKDENVEDDHLQLQKYQSELQKIGDSYSSSDIYFPKDSQDKNVDIALVFTYKTAENAEEAVKLLENMDSNVKVCLGHVANMGDYDAPESQDFEEDKKKAQNFPKKIWLNYMSDANKLEKSGQRDEALEGYKRIFVHTANNNFQSIASDAAAGIASVKIRNGDLEGAIDGMITDLNELKVQYVTAKAIRNLSSAYLLNKNVPAAALLSIYGLTQVKPGTHYFEALLAHMNEYYSPQFQILQKEMEKRKEPFSKLSLSQLLEAVSNLRLDAANIEANPQLMTDLNNFSLNGAICLEEREKDEVPLTSSENLSAKLADSLGNTIRHYRAGKFFDAANCCRDAIKYTLTEAERCVVRYCQAMSLLASKSLDNVKEGHSLLKELYEKRGLNWEKQFPAIFIGLAKYENAVNAKPQFVDIDEETFEDLQYPRKKDLLEVFPELDENQAKNILQKCVDFKPEILATCRFQDCEKVHKKQVDKSQVLHWKQTICVQDLDYKGFYTTECTEKCHVDFHPWCWKSKKDIDMIKNDKEYLKQNCSTPDCGAPIAYLKVTKDQGQDPIEFKDDELTKRRLEEFNKAKLKAAEEAKAAKKKKANKADNAGDSEVDQKSTPTRNRRSPKTSESSYDDNSTSEDLLKKVEELKEQLDLKDAELRNTNRQLRTVSNEKERLEKDLETQKKTSKRHYEDLQKEQNRKSEEMIRMSQSVESLKSQTRSLKGSNSHLQVQKELELCQTIREDMRNYKDFVGFVNEHMFQESKVLPEFLRTLENRMQKAEQVLHNNSQGLQGAMGVLYQMPIAPDYSELMMEIVNKNTKADKAGQAAALPSPTTIKELTKLIHEWFPDLTTDEIGNYVLEIKAKKGRLLGLPNQYYYEYIEKAMDNKNRECECSICFEPMNDGRETKTLECKHKFCKHCIDRHFLEKSDCPLCRKHHVEPEDFPALPGANRRP